MTLQMEQMVQLAQANWLILVAALVIAILLAWWLFSRSGKPPVRDRRPDVLDEGAAPAQRNNALINAPPAAAIAPPVIVPPAAAGTFAGVGEVVASGGQREAETVLKRESVAPTPVPTPVHAPTPVEAPAPEAEPAPEATPAQVEVDDLRLIKGLGPKLVTALHALGITRFAQIAAWTDADLDDLDTKLGAFAGRPRRDSWVEQAQLLSGGDTSAYEAKFGKL